MMSTLFGIYPFLSCLFADSDYQKSRFRAALKKVLAYVNGDVGQAIGNGERRIGLAKATGREPYFRIARMMPQSGQGLAVSEPQAIRSPASAVHQAHAQKAAQSMMNVAGRL